MRTTIALDDKVLEEARQKALDEHLSLAKYIELALCAKFAEDAREATPPYRPVKTFKGTGIREGVDLNDSASLLNAMEGN